MVEPEFPQSSGAVGARRLPPHPSISIVFSVLFTRAPSAPMHANVLAQSTPLEKFCKRLVPPANAANMAYRCEMDLSPRKRSVPVMLRAGRMICSLFAVMEIRQPKT